MLFSYVYVPHSMEKMQEYIDYIFYEVWCKTSESGIFSFDLFNGKPDLKKIMEAFHYSDAKGADFFNGHVEKIYSIFSTLSAEQVSQLRSWYTNNNDLEKVCCNDPSVNIVRYEDLRKFHKELSEPLASFFKGLYSKDFLNLAALRGEIGKIDDHYQQFMAKNIAGKCPFCGIQDIKGIYHSKREAYDHYLPKGVYPFNSINFKNLAPTCHECNSAYKLIKDPVFNPKDPLLNASNGRRKAFYPYSEDSYQIELKLELDCADWSSIKPEDIQISAGPEEIKEEINTWNDVYGIEERYKAKCCGENDGMYWIQQVLDEWHENGRSPEEYLETLSRHTKRKPYAEANFLKEPFLKACKQEGLFDK